MKSSLIILLLCAFIALCYSTPVPQEEAPSRPIFDAISTANKVVMDYGKRGAETVGNFIDNTGEVFSNGITSAAHFFSSGINRPFQSADEA